MFNGGPRLRVALESRWITKSRSPQILYSRSFVVLFVQQNFFIITATPCKLQGVAVIIMGRLLLFAWEYLEWYSEGYSAEHKGVKIGDKALLERLPTALLHLTPAGLGYCKASWKEHIVYSVYVFYGFGPHCCHHSLYVRLLLIG